MHSPQGTLVWGEWYNIVVRTIALRWLKQAEADFVAAQDSLKSGHYEWSCFQAQQAGEKALKAYLYEKGYTSIVTHSLKELVRECARLDGVFETIAQEAKTLDMFYIPTRYPNGLGGELVPAEFYEKEDAEKCLRSAASILEIVKHLLKP